MKVYQELLTMKEILASVLSEEFGINAEGGSRLSGRFL